MSPTDTDIPQDPESNPLGKSVCRGDSYIRKREVGDSTEPERLRIDRQERGAWGVLVILREDHHSSDPSPEAK